MQWQEIRDHYPNQWLLVEAVAAHTDKDRRIIDELAVIDSFVDSTTALHRYRDLHHTSPERELYVLHTSRESLDIAERQWLGVRALQ
jgi:hypothetical protein